LIPSALIQFGKALDLIPGFHVGIGSWWPSGVYPMTLNRSFGPTATGYPKSDFLGLQKNEKKFGKVANE
jgi:hypothetical protein